MKRKLLSMLAIVLVATVALQCYADLESKDSSQFAYKYDMVENPTTQDLDNSGKKDFAGGGSWMVLNTGVNVGSCTMTMTGSQYLKADAGSIGVDGDVWRKMNATTGQGGTGYTVEVRLKVLECTGSKGALLLNASTGDSSINSWLAFKTDKLLWSNDTDQRELLKDIDLTTWHTYRIVREPESKLHSVYMDGDLVADNLPNGISASVNRIILGTPNDDYQGKAEVAWLRFDKGAYAPVDEKAYVKANRMLSSDFDVKYEMGDDDTRISPTSTTSYWKIGGSGATVTKSGGLLQVAMSTAKNAYWDTTDAVWKKFVTKETPYTAEFSVKILTNIDGTGRTLQFLTGSNGAVGNLFIGPNSVQWCLSASGSRTFITLDTSDNTDKLHKFRIAYDGFDSRHGFTVWRDGVKIGENLVDCTNFHNYSGNQLGIVRFGKAGDMNAGSYDLDYIRWKIGGVYPPDNRQSLFIILR